MNTTSMMVLIAGDDEEFPEKRYHVTFQKNLVPKGLLTLAFILTNQSAPKEIINIEFNFNTWIAISIALFGRTDFQHNDSLRIYKYSKEEFSNFEYVLTTDSFTNGSKSQLEQFYNNGNRRLTDKDYFELVNYLKSNADVLRSIGLTPNFTESDLRVVGLDFDSFVYINAQIDNIISKSTFNY